MKANQIQENNYPYSRYNHHNSHNQISKIKVSETILVFFILPFYKTLLKTKYIYERKKEDEVDRQEQIFLPRANSSAKSNNIS